MDNRRSVQPEGVGRLIAERSPASPLSADSHSRAIDWAMRFRSFIRDGDFPCVGAKSAIGRSQMTVYVGTDLSSAWDDVALVRELIQFAGEYRETRKMFLTFVALFPESRPMDEEAFEAALWERVRSLQDKDEWLGQKYDSSVSGDPAAPNFSLSFGGQSFFMVGMHPNASRPARRFDVPALVFNLHDQFERLRAQGRYDKLRSAILKRDEEVSGSVNPMLARHGEESEARQYSGRIVGPDWECPWPGRT